MFQTKFVEKVTTHVVYSLALFTRRGAVCELLLKNMVEPDRPQMAM